MLVVPQLWQLSWGGLDVGGRASNSVDDAASARDDRVVMMTSLRIETRVTNPWRDIAVSVERRSPESGVLTWYRYHRQSPLSSLRSDIVTD